MDWPAPDPEVEIYPMPSYPMLQVSDLVAAARWYQEALGFQHVFTMPGPDGSPRLVHLRWARYADLLLVPEARPAPGPRGLGVTLGYTLEEGTVDDLVARARAAGATIVSGPVDRPWNAREVTIADPDGYRLTFSRVIDTRLTWEALGVRLTRPNESLP